MNSDSNFARLAAKELAGEEIPLRPPVASSRARTLEAVRDAIRMQSRARRRRRVAVWTIGVAASFALVASAVSLGHRQASSEQVASRTPDLGAAIQGTLQLNHAGDARLASGNTVLVPGDRVVAVDAPPVALVLSSGTRLVLTSGSDLAVLESGATQSFGLGNGSVRADVAKQHAGERFLVRTVDTEVEVRGTSFVVESVPSDPLCGGGARTRVRVDEGIVSVRFAGSEVRVAAGERWPAGCASPSSVPAAQPASDTPASSASSAPLTSAPKLAARPGVHEMPPSTPAVRTEEAARKGSELRDQNALFAEALAAKRRGDGAAALKMVNDLLQRYPSGPLTENALVERMRLSSGVAAVKAAREYLDRYPSGFARAEADGIAGP